MRKINLKIILVIVLSTFILCIGVYYIFLRNEISMQQMLEKNEPKDIYPYSSIFFSDFGEVDFTCTGLTFDEKEECFWIVDNGHLKTGLMCEPSLVKVDRELKQQQDKIYLGNVLEGKSDVQGVTYDTKTDTFWISSKQWIYNIDRSAKLINKIKVFCYPMGFVNSVAYDKYTDSIWVLTSKNGLYNYSKDGEVLKKYNFNIEEQDHIFLANENSLYISFGANYCSNENYIVEINLESGVWDKVYCLNESYAMEGIYILEDILYVVNDGLYHDALINKSYINKYVFY